ncbi:hypothetical protein CL622_02605 [archaeon]|nr:hypothetical protein [archaeon]
MKNKKTTLNFRRFEFKYILPAKLSDLLVGSISKFVTPDPYAQDNGYYFVNSIYLDSPQLHSYRQKQNGLRKRKKYRLRYYGQNPNIFTNPLFFEIKRKDGAIIIKDRIIINSQKLKQISLSSWKNISQKHPNFFSEFYRDYRTLQLKPKLIIQYKRQPFFSRFNKNFRITFDYDLKSAKTNNFNLDRLYLKNTMPHLAVMEVKFNGGIPPWFSYIIKSNNLRRNSFSKYCHAVDQIYKLDP